MFRVTVHTSGSNRTGSIDLDLEAGTTAGKVIRDVRKESGEAYVTQEAGNIGEHESPRREAQEWRLRTRRIVEEGTWWSEKDIEGYTDRESPLWSLG